MRALIMLLALAGCTGFGGQTHTAEEDLSRELAGRVAGPPETCVSDHRSRSLQIVDRRTLTYRAGDTLWVNRLAADCPGLRPLNTLIVEKHGSQLCRGDRVRGIEPGSTIPGPMCPLGDFIPYRRAR